MSLQSGVLTSSRDSTALVHLMLHLESSLTRIRIAMVDQVVFIPWSPEGLDRRSKHIIRSRAVRKRHSDQKQARRKLPRHYNAQTNYSYFNPSNQPAQLSLESCERFCERPSDMQQFASTSLPFCQPQGLPEQAVRLDILIADAF